MVNWNDAAEFCEKLSLREKLKPNDIRDGKTITLLKGTGYRLPTEAEWEFACRAGTTSRFWIGNEAESLVAAGWFRVNAGGRTPAEGRTHAVGNLLANPFGLFDMHGNVWEWVQDIWDSAYYGASAEQPAVDPCCSSSSDPRRVIRGGNWFDVPSNCQSSNRVPFDPLRSWPNIGFRVSLVVDSSVVTPEKK